MIRGQSPANSGVRLAQTEYNSEDIVDMCCKSMHACGSGRVQQRPAVMLWTPIVQWGGVLEFVQQIWELMQARQQDREKGPEENNCEEWIVNKCD